MFGKFTFWLTLFAMAVCAVNYYGYDPDHMLLYMTSIPVWFIEMFGDIHMNMIFTYLLTVLFYSAAGLFIDAMIAKYRRRRA